MIDVPVQSSFGISAEEVAELLNEYPNGRYDLTCRDYTIKRSFKPFAVVHLKTGWGGVFWPGEDYPETVMQRSHTDEWYNRDYIATLGDDDISKLLDVGKAVLLFEGVDL